MKIAGIDPGTIRLGWCIVETVSRENAPNRLRLNPFEYVSSGTVEASAKVNRLDRLHRISADLDRVFARTPVDVVVLERVYLGRNVSSALAIAEARGVVIAVAARHDADLVEYTASEARKAIGAGGASGKEKAQRIASMILGTPFPSEDAGDAAILASAHAISLPGR